MQCCWGILLPPSLGNQNQKHCSSCMSLLGRFAVWSCQADRLWGVYFSLSSERWNIGDCFRLNLMGTMFLKWNLCPSAKYVKENNHVFFTFFFLFSVHLLTTLKQGYTWAVSRSIIWSWQMQLPLLCGTKIAEATLQVGWGSWAEGQSSFYLLNFPTFALPSCFSITPSNLFFRGFAYAVSLFFRAIPSFIQDCFGSKSIKASPASSAI